MNVAALQLQRNPDSHELEGKLLLCGNEDKAVYQQYKSFAALLEQKAHQVSNLFMKQFWQKQSIPGGFSQ